MTLRRSALALATLLLVALTATTAGALAAGRLSFTEIQPQFMCVLCREPLNEARSAEAYGENAQLRSLIAAGDSLPQIKREMVAQYGEGVLADPPAHGFNLLVFIIPGVVIVAGLLVVAVTVPRWRRRASAQQKQTGTQPDGGPPLSDADAARLDADLARQT